MVAKNIMKPKKLDPKQKSVWKNWHFYVAFVILSFIFYGNSIKNKYAMDDDLVTTTYNYPTEKAKDRNLVSRHENVEMGIAGIPKIFVSHYAVNKKQSYAYRPVVTSTFAIEYQFFGSNPGVSHFFSVLLYGLTVILIFRFIRVAMPRANILYAVIVAILFLIHPLHSEVVNNIKSRDELLCLSFGVAFMIHLMKYMDSKKWISLVYAAVFILLSLLCKRTGIIFIPISLLALYFFRQVKILHLLFFAIGLGVLFFIWRGISAGLLDEKVTREMGFFENPLNSSSSMLERIPMYFYSNYYYVCLLLFPYPLIYYYGYNQVEIATWADPIVWIAAVVMIAIVGVLFYRIKKRESWVFGALFFFIAIGGACNLLFPAVGIIAERFAFVASFGFSISVGWLIYRLIKSKLKSAKLITYGVIGVIALSSLVMTVKRNADWMDRETLYTTDIEHQSESAKSHSLLGQYYANISKSIQRKMQNSKLQGDQRMIQQVKEASDSAIYHFTRCVEIYEGYTVSYNNLGAMYFTYRGDNINAQKNFQTAVDQDSAYVEANVNLGNSILADGEKFEKVQRLITGYTDTTSFSNNVDQTFLKKNSQMLDTYVSFLSGLRSVIDQAAREAKSSESFITGLRSRLSIGVSNYKMDQLFNANQFDADLLRFADTIPKLASAGLLVDYMENLVLDNMSKQCFDNYVKGKVNHEFLKIQVSSEADSIKQLGLFYVKSAIKYNDKYSPAYDRIINYYQKYGQFDEVIEVCQKALAVKDFPQNSNFYRKIYTTMANAHSQMGNMSEVIVNLDFAIIDVQSRIQSNKADKALDKRVRRQIESQLKNQLRQLYDNIASLYNNQGDVINAQKYLLLKSKV
jgi:tetratricopeptide (TPR) repeat protein